MSWTLANRRARRASRAWCAACVLVWAVAVTEADAHAQTKSGDAAMAETLFNDAKGRMAAGDFAAACPKLAESYRLDPGAGTLTALAVCHESLGKTASAWTEFIQVASESQQAGRSDRAGFAQQHVDALAPKLSKLAIVVDAAVATLPGLEVKRDGTVIGEAGWATEAPVDPGSHTVEVTATGKKPWSTSVDVGAVADVQTVNVPPLEDAVPTAGVGPSGIGAGNTDTTAEGEPNGGQEAGADHTSSTAGNTQRTAGLVVGAAGLVSAAVGAYFGVTAVSKAHDANAICPANACPDMNAVQESSDAKSAAVIADVAFGGAIAAVGVGAILYLTAPTAPASGTSTASIRFRPVASPRGVSLLLDGHW